MHGWIKSKRSSKNCAFLAINDGTVFNDFQIVIGSESSEFNRLKDCVTGAAVRVDGVLKESPGKGQSWELQADRVDIIGGCDSSYPLQKKGHSLEFLREISHLRGRSNTFGAVFRARNTLAQIIHEYFRNNGFHWVHTPIITAGDSEGAGELFQVTTLDMAKGGVKDYEQDFFGKKSFLTVSGQLNAEALALSMSRVYTFGPTFRAENSNTTRHLSEFWMLEPEMAFADLADDMVLAEEFLRSVFSQFALQCPEEICFFKRFYDAFSVEDLQEMAEKPFGRIRYSDAISELKKASVDFEYPVEWGIDLQTEHERYLTDVVFKRPVIVTDYPKEIKAFYMRLNGDEKTVAAMDVLVPRIGEIIGGSQREERAEVLTERMIAMGLEPQEFSWYLDLRKFGGAPHAGFGLGFDRLVQYLTGMANIRDVIPFPRAPSLISF